MAAKQGFLMYYSKGDAIGTKVSVRYRRSGRLSGVVVKRGSTVALFLAVASLLLCSFLKCFFGLYIFRVIVTTTAKMLPDFTFREIHFQNIWKEKCLKQNRLVVQIYLISL